MKCRPQYGLILEFYVYAFCLFGRTMTVTSSLFSFILMLINRLLFKYMD